MFKLFRKELKMLKFSKFFPDQIGCFSPLSMYRELRTVVLKFGKSNILFSCSPTLTSFEKILQLESFERIYYRPIMKFSMREFTR